MLLLVSLLAAAGHALSTLELRTSEAHREAVAVFYRADGALQDYLGRLQTAPGPAVSVAVGGGSAAISARRLLALPDGRSLHGIRARAATAPAGGGSIRRGVGRVVVTAGDVRLPAALVTWGTLDAAAGSTVLDGFDHAADGGCLPGRSVAGLALPAASEPPSSTRVDARGEPPVLALEDASRLRRLSGVDWAALLEAFGPRAAARVPEEPWPVGSPEGGAGDLWPVIRVLDAHRLDGSHAGRGAIVADGHLELADGFAWDGLLLVEGHLSLVGPVRIRGGIAAGLGALAGRAPGAVTISGAGVDVRFHSCHATAAAEALTLPPVAVPGTWFEEMESWF